MDPRFVAHRLKQYPRMPIIFAYHGVFAVTVDLDVLTERGAPEGGRIGQILCFAIDHEDAEPTLMHYTLSMIFSPNRPCGLNSRKTSASI